MEKQKKTLEKDMAGTILINFSNYVKINLKTGRE